MSVKRPRETAILASARSAGILRPRDLLDLGIARSYLQRMVNNGKLQRIGRGLYALPDHEPSQTYSLAEVCKQVPGGVVCLLSALRFHEIGTSHPSEVWLAIHPKAHRPSFAYPPLRIVRFSGKAHTEGVVEHRTAEGVVRIYDPAKTVVDCFRYRNKIGIDVAIEALRACLSARKATMDEIWRYAKLLRQSTVMRPYLEAIST